jgi:D-alanyl-D-alanine carboxypeptidase
MPAAAILALYATAANADPALDALVAAYPDQLAGYDTQGLIWKDGTRMPISDGRAKTFEELLNNPDIRDQFAIPYALGAVTHPPAVNDDPGRIRNEPFFLKMYGDCRRNELAPRLIPVPWMAKHGGGTLMATSVNGVADKLREVSQALEALPESTVPYLVPSAGAFNCRAIAETRRLSVHAFGAAIDIATRFSDYWLWSKSRGGTLTWKNRIPMNIVEIFERSGFIWGGKWYHFDTMHFEYRPELLLPDAKAG